MTFEHTTFQRNAVFSISNSASRVQHDLFGGFRMSEDNENMDNGVIRETGNKPYSPNKTPEFSAIYMRSSQIPENTGLGAIIEPAYKASVRRRRSRKYVEESREQLI